MSLNTPTSDYAGVVTYADDVAQHSLGALYENLADVADAKGGLAGQGDVVV